jgi:hypothetical protein
MTGFIRIAGHAGKAIRTRPQYLHPALSVRFGYGRVFGDIRRCGSQRRSILAFSDCSELAAAIAALNPTVPRIAATKMLFLEIMMQTSDF